MLSLIVKVTFMPVIIPKAKIYKTFSIANIKKQFQPRNIVSAMASDGFLPVIALEAFVEGGRTYQAYKRGGFDEARERITEEFSGAVFWLGGVTGLNWVFEKLGQKMLKLPKKTVDIASDNVRKPLDNFLAFEKFVSGKKSGTAISKDLMAKFKFTKVISSVLIANAFIGFVLPKINQAITRSYHKNDNKKQQNPQNQNFFNNPTIKTFGNKENKDISFSGLNLLAIANNFESKRNWKLLSVDVGTASGRAYSARNNDERVEILFRDLSSVFFYMFNMGLMNSFLNRIENGWNNKITSRLDASSAEFATEYMNNFLDSKDSKKATLSEFEKEFLGENKELPKELKSKFQDGIINLDEFKSELKNIVPEEKLPQIEELAKKMSELQPQIKGQSILTEAQVKDILNGGHINNPEFLKEFYKNRFGNKFTEKYKYIAQGDIDALKSDLMNYVNSIIEKAKSSNAQEITKDMLKKASKHNFKMNAFNWGAGFVISAAFLSTFIPKLQYLITKLRTGEDAFPGTEQYRNNNN